MKTLIISFIINLIAINVNAQISSRKYNEAANLIAWPAEFDPKNSDFYVHNEIEIMAKPEVVWQLLVQASNWENWYDGIQNIRFENQGQRVLEPETKVFWNSMGQSLNNKVTQFEPNKTLAWQFNEKKIQGMHAWVIIPTEEGCKVVTDESQTGQLAKLQKIFLPNKLRKQHDNWLRLLKQEAEKSNPELGNRLNTSEREKMVKVLQQSQEKFTTAIHGLSEEQIKFKPASGKWSIAECIEHITLAELRFPEIVHEEMLKPADPHKRKKIKIKDEAIREKMISSKWKARSPEVFKPSGRFEDTASAISVFNNQRRATIDYVKTSQDDLRNHFWRHPLFGTIDLYQTLLLMSAHLERHAEQIESNKWN
ncbi:MAG: DinB family protein [Cyclobacteriaceae bacterium]|nr:DinB family protein [Cyclobacteriaceae bacterium]